MEMTDIQRSFVEQWGEMGTRWGINRSVAAVHALLYLTPEPLTAEDISDTLTMARSNVSQALKELEGWQLVFRESRVGDRKSYYRCESDVWEMARCIIRERKKREADGALRAVSDCLDLAKERGDGFTVERLSAMKGILEQNCHFADIALKVPTSTLKRLVGMGARLFQFIGK